MADEQKQNQIRAQLIEKLSSLDSPAISDEEKAVLSLRWGFESGNILPIEEVAQLLGKSREYVRRTEENALTKLRD